MRSKAGADEIEVSPAPSFQLAGRQNNVAAGTGLGAPEDQRSEDQSSEDQSSEDRSPQDQDEGDLDAGVNEDALDEDQLDTDRVTREPIKI